MSAPSAEFNIKKFMESAEYNQKRAMMNFEINADKVKIDYLIFKKSPQEKLECSRAKSQWKLSQKNLPKD